MFSLLRAALVIGAIFYFSPVRQGANETLSLDGLWNSAGQVSEQAGDTPERLSAAWNALPESARQALIARIAPTGQHPAPTRPPQTDTLLPEDHRPAWTGPRKPSLEPPA